MKCDSLLMWWLQVASSLELSTTTNCIGFQLALQLKIYEPRYPKIFALFFSIFSSSDPVSSSFFLFFLFFFPFFLPSVIFFSLLLLLLFYFTFFSILLFLLFFFLIYNLFLLATSPPTVFYGIWNISIISLNKIPSSISTQLFTYFSKLFVASHNLLNSRWLCSLSKSCLFC